MKSFPAHRVCNWISNREAVAQEHYLQVTDDHFELAAKGNAESGAVPSKSARIAQYKKQQSLALPEKYEATP